MIPTMWAGSIASPHRRDHWVRDLRHQACPVAGRRDRCLAEAQPTVVGRNLAMHEYAQAGGGEAREHTLQQHDVLEDAARQRYDGKALP